MKKDTHAAAHIGSVLSGLIGGLRPEAEQGMLGIWKVWDRAAGDEVASRSYGSGRLGLLRLWHAERRLGLWDEADLHALPLLFGGAFADRALDVPWVGGGEEVEVAPGAVKAQQIQIPALLDVADSPFKTFSVRVVFKIVAAPRARRRWCGRRVRGSA